MVYLVLATFVVNLLVCVTLYLLPRSHFKQTQLRRAFETLEEEFDDLRDTVRSSVGRISRLKRSMLEASGTSPAAEPSLDGSDADPQGQPKGSLTEGQRRWQAKILARRGITRTQ